jgi:hypothetical protein
MADATDEVDGADYRSPGETGRRSAAGAAEQGLDVAERRALDRARSVARVLDEAVRVPGTRFRVGLDPILGVAPVSGDAVAALGALYVVFTGVKLGVPLSVTLTMLANVLVDFAAGSIPVLGTIIDAKLKVNRRNVELLESELATR